MTSRLPFLAAALLAGAFALALAPAAYVQADTPGGDGPFTEHEPDELRAPILG
ncbi:hypothetical protein GCM10010329_02630 [Streptomyces spiroverticillatus]|uniref:Uncharacterized protein n=1 Tax=Streptomyces finlayi TaxID=67296 RepID=A0A919C7B6_9ACTN|nr:hypothetical protein [Streptomyces finlayi]GGZ86328.1 hypothetical protein GCM10010329_02630 [Streptomyces spiroverticillatus]GHC77851.1 hypothetical protein GCM10010334_02620 [Streptomyces finlayi]